MKLSKRRIYQAAAVLLLLITGFYLFVKKEPVSQADRLVYQTVAPDLVQKSDYYSLRPDGEVTGGVIIFPDSKEDPASYAAMAKKLAQQGLEIRVVKYPLGLPQLSGAERTILEDGNQLPWVSLGFGQGGIKACSLADKSPQVAGLILTGNCDSQVNLNDNDLQVTVYQMADHPLALSETAQIQKRLPADTNFLIVSSQEEILEEIAGNQPEIQRLTQSGSLVSEIRRLIANKTVKLKNK